ncbi:hypothetical protein [Nocardia sp. bgisy134]|uniref:hypothetical protein n=1 Tax=Nocardia sp. bgisy134 TaxID=3413789 RepID=UPI003D73D9FB
MATGGTRQEAEATLRGWVQAVSGGCEHDRLQSIEIGFERRLDGAGFQGCARTHVYLQLTGVTRQ